MLSRPRLLLLSGLVLFSGCHTAKKVAVSSFRVIDTPARFVRDRIEPEEPTSTTSTTTTTTDVVNPGHPVVAATATQRPAPSSSRTTPNRTANSTPAASRAPVRSETRPSATATPRPPSASGQGFPTARPVPGKPGYVYSIDPNGGIIDVNGYKSGEKAKDPYTQQIFIVP